MRLLAKLQRSLDFWFLLGTSFVFFLLRLPSFFEPYWYGDEGVYEVVGYAIRHGKLLYQDIWDNKPPLLYLLYALFNGDQIYIKIFSCIVGLVSVWIFFAVTKLIFENKKSTYLATAFFALFLGLPYLEGNIANAENFMILPIVAAVYLFVNMLKYKKNSLITLFLSGLFLGVAFLIKVVSVFDFATLSLLLIFFTWTASSTIKVTKQIITMGIGFFFPLFLTMGFFYAKGILLTFIQSAFLSNIGYVNYGNQFIIPQGFLIVKLLLLAVALIIIFAKRKTLSLGLLLVYTWLLFSLFNVFFSQRPYTHYLLGLLTSVSLLVGMLTEKHLRKLNIGLLIVIIFLIVKNFWLYSNTVFYYGTFVQMLTGQKTIMQYRAFFDKGVPRDYAIAEFLLSHAKPNQKIFLWTNSPQMYYLIHRLPLGRYTVAYHMTFTPTAMKETARMLSTEKPTFIVILPNAQQFPFRITDYRLKVAIQDGLIYERIF